MATLSRHPKEKRVAGSSSVFSRAAVRTDVIFEENKQGAENMASMLVTVYKTHLHVCFNRRAKRAGSSGNTTYTTYMSHSSSELTASVDWLDVVRFRFFISPFVEHFLLELSPSRCLTRLQLIHLARTSIQYESQP